MNPTFDTEAWENIIVLGLGLLFGGLMLWLTVELRAVRREIRQNTELLRLWLLAFDSARKSGAVFPIADTPEHPNDLLK